MFINSVALYLIYLWRCRVLWLLIAIDLVLIRCDISALFNCLSCPTGNTCVICTSVTSPQLSPLICEKFALFKSSTVWAYKNQSMSHMPFISFLFKPFVCFR